MEEQDSEIARLKALARLRLIDGKIRALDLGWPLIEAVESANDDDAARNVLMAPPFGFDEMQAAHILDTQLRARTLAGRRALEAERAELETFLRAG